MRSQTVFIRSAPDDVRRTVLAAEAAALVAAEPSSTRAPS